MDLLLQSLFDHRHSINAAAGSLLSCLAVITAAIGLWYIRTVGSRPSARPIEILVKSASPTVKPPPRPPPPKSRFTAYYSYEAAEDHNEYEEEEGNDGISDGGLAAPWEEPDWGWEGIGIRSVRNRDLGWYRYQELTALNGSVVRFWNGDVALTTKSLKWSRQLL